MGWINLDVDGLRLRQVFTVWVQDVPRLLQEQALVVVVLLVQLHLLMHQVGLLEQGLELMLLLQLAPEPDDMLQLTPV